MNLTAVSDRRLCPAFAAQVKWSGVSRPAASLLLRGDQVIE
jgi:hypothetical protein